MKKSQNKYFITILRRGKLQTTHITKKKKPYKILNNNAKTLH